MSQMRFEATSRLTVFSKRNQQLRAKALVRPVLRRGSLSLIERPYPAYCLLGLIFDRQICGGL